MNDSGGVSISFALRVAVMVLFLLETEVELEAEEVAVRRWGRRSKRGGRKPGTTVLLVANLVIELL